MSHPKLPRGSNSPRPRHLFPPDRHATCSNHFTLSVLEKSLFTVNRDDQHGPRSRWPATRPVSLESSARTSLRFDPCRPLSVLVGICPDDMSNHTKFLILGDLLGALRGFCIWYGVQSFSLVTIQYTITAKRRKEKKGKFLMNYYSLSMGRMRLPKEASSIS